MPEGFSLKARHIAYSRTGHVAPLETFVLVNCLCLARTLQKHQGRGYKPRPASAIIEVGQEADRAGRSG